MHIKRILCPVDFSPNAEQALTYAVSLAKTIGAEVEALHAYPISSYQFTDGAITMPAEVLAEHSDRLEKELKALVKSQQAKGVTIRTRLVVGAPHEAIVDALEQGDYDMVVMGTHGRRGLRRAWLGSVAERVVRNARQPVLTVPIIED